MGFTIATLQKTPKHKPICIGLFFLGEDQRVWVQTKTRLVPYKATLVTPNGDAITSNSETFLKELARQTKLSQVSYFYTESEDTAEEVRSLLLTNNA